MPDRLKTHERAARMEILLPQVMRALFRPALDDPLSELTMAQIRIMRILYAEDRTPSDLGEELGMSVSAVTQMSNRLEHMMLIERIDDKEDRRVKHLRLTENGRFLMLQRHDRRVSNAADVLALLSEERQAEILDVLEELRRVTSLNRPISEPDSLVMVAEMEGVLPPLPANSRRDKQE